MSHLYLIIIAGSISETAGEAFTDFRIQPQGTNTALIGELDQPGLFNALNRIQSLGLELVEVSRLTDNAS
jgi:hypothetical protein